MIGYWPIATFLKLLLCEHGNACMSFFALLGQIVGDLIQDADNGSSIGKRLFLIIVFVVEIRYANAYSANAI